MQHVQVYELSPRNCLNFYLTFVKGTKRATKRCVGEPYLPAQGRNIRTPPSQTVKVVNRIVSLSVTSILAPFSLSHRHRWAATRRNHYLLALIHFFAFRPNACLIFTKISSFEHRFVSSERVYKRNKNNR